MALVGNGDIIDEYLGRARGTESVDAEIDGLILSRSDLLAIRLEDGARSVVWPMTSLVRAETLSWLPHLASITSL